MTCTLAPPIQETGRAGRDGKQSVAYLIYQGILLNHVDKDMKQYVKTEECRQKTLNKFDNSSSVNYPQPIHLCCDNCAAKGKCGSSDCASHTRFPGRLCQNATGVSISSRFLDLSPRIRKTLFVNLSKIITSHLQLI